MIIIDIVVIHCASDAVGLSQQQLPTCPAALFDDDNLPAAAYFSL